MLEKMRAFALKHEGVEYARINGNVLVIGISTFDTLKLRDIVEPVAVTTPKELLEALGY